MRFPRIAFPLLVWSVLLLVLRAEGQSPNGNINGLVLDPTNRVIAGAEVIAVNDLTNGQFTTKTNGEGIYVLPSLPPGSYRLQVSKAGFKTIIKPDITLNVQDALSINFTLPLGALLETVTVEGGAPLVNTESATVSTVVDRQFAENMPLNGRSFQTLIQLTPGVVLTPSNNGDAGQFSVNGQRANANYFMVDGVSANFGIGTNGVPGNGAGGALPGFGVQGGTNSLVSVDALQEFRIQTSTFAPEFGRTPGAQISILTRSGTNQFRGTVFDYLRNDLFDANDWFADNAVPRLDKPEERQNDFGGVFGGPVIKNKTFFFFSYEGLRLRLPQVAQAIVPSLSARASAVPAIQPFFNAYPLPAPSAPDNNGMSPFNASFSNKSSLDAYSIRIDHRLGSRLALFGRYNYSPSELLQRGGLALSVIAMSRIAIQTATFGATWSASPSVADDFRVNYSRSDSSGAFSADDFGGAVPLTGADLGFPSPYKVQDSRFSFFILGPGDLIIGRSAHELQRQINIINSLSIQKGAHSLKIGGDYRRLSPSFDPLRYSQSVFFFGVPSAESGQGLENIAASRGGVLLFHNLGMFAQDTWRAQSRITVTYGLRWDVDFVPSTGNGPSLVAVTNFNDLSKLGVAPDGTPVFKTKYTNLAPRIGLAFQASKSQNWQTILRGGFGVFYDLATQEVGEATKDSLYPFGASTNFFPASFPLDPSLATPPPISIDQIASQGVYSFDPNLRLPYTLQWNSALEQSMGKNQVLSASYLGASGKRLIQTEEVALPNNPNVPSAELVTNAGRSAYNALQLQYQLRLSHGLQALASYSWSHSIDTASASSLAVSTNQLVSGADPNINRGPSDFDIRNAGSAGVTYNVPLARMSPLADRLLGGWSIQTLLQVRSAPPVDVYYSALVQLLGSFTAVRPDVVRGIPFYLYGRQYPGGKIINNIADQGGTGCIGPFCPPPIDPNGAPLRQGNLSRNALRGFGATQWDFSVHRDFPIHDSIKLQFRAEMFNILNHPNFGPPVADLNDPRFGQSIQTLGHSLDSSNQGSGSFSPLYQIGGPRSIQFGLKLMF